MIKPLCLAPLVLLAAGCAARIPPPQTPAFAPASPQQAWANHLARFVDEKGRMDYAGMAKSTEDLDTFLAWVARIDPESAPADFPTREARLAYYINAYNALAMYDVLKSNFPPNLYDVRVGFFYRNRFEMGGRYVSLYALENSVIRPMGEERIHFALNCMARGCPRLPPEPFEAATLNAQVEAAAREFFNDPRHCEPVPEKGVVRLSSILDWYEKDFLAKAPSLIDYANRYRDEKIGTAWKVEFIPYDWTLNAQ